MTIFGPDISKWQDGLAPAHLGFGYFMARASIGHTVDYLFDEALAYAKANQVPFAGYHFPYEVSSHPAAEQAATFDEACRGDRQIKCMIDWESDGSQAATVSDAVAVAEAIIALGYDVTLLYTGTWYWQQQGSPDMTVLDTLGIGLIISNYGSNSKGEHEAIYAGRGGDTASFWSNRVGGVLPSIWQFGSQVRIGDNANGSPMYGDCNAFRGTTADLAKFFTTWGATPPQPPTTEDDMQVLYRHAKYADSFLIGAAPPLHVSPELYEAFKNGGVTEVVDANNQTLDQVLDQSGFPKGSLTKL